MTTLDELRRANLKEQRQSAGTEPPAAPAVQEIVSEVTEASKELPAPTPPAALLEAPQAMAMAPEKPVPVQPQTQAEKPSQASDIVERVHQALVRKVIYPTGVKATVDMPPELFWRLKRYCRDHNNATLRQVFLDVMMAYLDEEGY